MSKEKQLTNMKHLTNGFAGFIFSHTILNTESQILEIIPLLGLAVTFLSIGKPKSFYKRYF